MNKIIQAVVVVVLVVTIPAVAGGIFAGAQGAFAGVVASFISFLISTAAGWRRALWIMPFAVPLAVLAGVVVPGPLWVLMLAAVGLMAGLASRWGLLSAGALVGLQLSLAQPIESLERALIVLVFGALGAAYGILVSRRLQAPPVMDGPRSTVSHSVMLGILFSMVAGLAGWLASIWGVSHSYWLPMTVFLLAMPITGHGLSSRTINRLIGTGVGVLVATAVLSLSLPPAVNILLGSITLVTSLAFPIPPWRATLFTSLTVVLILDSRGTADYLGWERVEATLAAGALMLVGLVIALLLQRLGVVSSDTHELVEEYAESEFGDDD